jgi:hypothetical protein
MTYTYIVYGLVISTTFPCKVLPSAAPQAVPDVIVGEGEVAPHLTAPVAEGLRWEVEPGRFLFRGGGRTGRFLAEDGSRVTMQRAPGAEDDMLASSLLDSVLVALLRQRGKLVLHANTALTPKGALAIGGESGAGKSTTLTVLLQQGCVMFSDDISVLQLNGEGQVEVLPGIPQLNLTEDAAQGLEYDISHFSRHQRRRAKAVIPTHEQMSLLPAPLRALYLLEKKDVEEVHARLLSGAEKFSAVQSCIYGPLLPKEHLAIFPLITALVEQISIFRVERPAKRWSVSDVINVILSTDY